MVAVRGKNTNLINILTSYASKDFEQKWIKWIKNEGHFYKEKEEIVEQNELKLEPIKIKSTNLEATQNLANKFNQSRDPHFESVIEFLNKGANSLKTFTVKEKANVDTWKD